MNYAAKVVLFRNICKKNRLGGRFSGVGCKAHRLCRVVYRQKNAYFSIFLHKNLPMSAKNSTFAANLLKKLAARWNIYLLVSLLRNMV